MHLSYLYYICQKGLESCVKAHRQALKREKGGDNTMKRKYLTGGSKKRLLAFGLAAVMLGTAGCASGGNAEEADGGDPQDVELAKSQNGNPLVGNSSDGAYIYGGDPSVLVDGDTVYLYTGHDVSTDDQVNSAEYNIPEYLCYSSTDMVNWKSEGVVMDMDDVSWASGNTSAWAAQVAKHYDKEAGKDRYYLYYCSWDKMAAGKQSIGVAVADSPTGPFTDIGEPLVRGSRTKPQTNNWNDIDPTVWVETDESGEEHRYLAWGNSMYYICELNEDMVSVTDQNGDGEITSGVTMEQADIVSNMKGLENFTEAPWLYRRQDENGNYYGDYYLFYAYNWRECMAYATTDDLLNGKWEFGQVLMMPTATSNTNHMAVFDFKGKTYFVYHNGSLPGGNGYRRSACVTELVFAEDGTVQPMEETAIGVSGTASTISLKSGETLSHKNFVNSIADSDYPYSKVEVGANMSEEALDAEWVLCNGKADASNGAYVSIQSENKPGLYLTAREDKTVTLAQDTKAAEETANKQTFHSVTGFADKEGVSFESVAYPGMYLTVQEGVLCLTDGSDKENATFYVAEAGK